jgi:hypothetical protein
MEHNLRYDLVVLQIQQLSFNTQLTYLQDGGRDHQLSWQTKSIQATEWHIICCGVWEQWPHQQISSVQLNIIPAIHTVAVPELAHLHLQLMVGHHYSQLIWYSSSVKDVYMGYMVPETMYPAHTFPILEMPYGLAVTVATWWYIDSGIYLWESPDVKRPGSSKDYGVCPGPSRLHSIPDCLMRQHQRQVFRQGE